MDQHDRDYSQTDQDDEDLFEDLFLLLPVLPGNNFRQTRQNGLTRCLGEFIDTANGPVQVFA